MHFKKIKIFQTDQEKFAFFNFERNQTAFDRPQLTLLAKSLLYLTSFLIYLLHVANTPRQYMDSILMTGTGTLIFISGVNMVFNKSTVFLLIDDVEGAVNESA